MYNYFYHNIYRYLYMQKLHVCYKFTGREKKTKPLLRMATKTNSVNYETMLNAR